jgi:hypothetical protein
MRERSIEPAPKYADISIVLGNLQENMRVFDALNEELSIAQFILDRHELRLGNVDLETPDSLDKLAVAALAGKVLTDKKIAALKADLSVIENDQRINKAFPSRYVGIPLSISAIDPSVAELEALFYTNDPTRQTMYQQCSGTIEEIDLSPASGGLLRVMSITRTQRYQAAPLFDRNQDYQPVFKVEQLETL